MHPQHPIPTWLFTCCALVFLMVIVGAITRLTESGLSIAEWKPLLGAIPPLTDAEWHRVFALYQQTPEFLKKNSWMDLPEFKQIFFWEWLHRFLGRFIGIAYALPLTYFWLRKKIPQGYKLKLLVPFILGGLQGALGWYMVASGLVDNPAVSHYRLAAHLLLAFLIFCTMLWLGLSILSPSPLRGEGRGEGKVLITHALITLAILLTTITFGAFTAGLDGGLIYNYSFPKMGGTWIPPEAKQSLIASPAGVQFVHRWLAMATFLMVLSFWLHGATKKKSFPALHALAFMIVIQFALGMATLFSHVALPLAVMHQAGALITLMLLVMCLHRLGKKINYRGHRERRV